jgi:hypothetical protein
MTAVEAALVDRLTAVLVTDLELVRVVYAHQDYADVPEVNMETPSLAVVYNGYTPGERIQPAGAIQTVVLGFLIVINVSSALQTDRGDGVRMEASPIFDAVMEALLGWRPIPKFQPLKLEPAPGAALSDAGFGYYPVAFSTAATYRGKP